MPLVILRTGFLGPDGREETIQEYLCDQAGCTKVAVHVVGVVKEIGQVAAVCDDHTPRRHGRPTGDPIPE